MAQQLIDVGMTPNDGTGDPLRTAAIKINENFTELYNGAVSAGQPSLLLSEMDELASASSQTGDLDAVGSLGGSELLHLVDADGTSVRLTLAALKTFINTDPSVVPSSLPYRGARVRRTSNISIANNTVTAVSWQNADLNTDSIWSLGAPTRLVVPTGVTKVRLSAGARWTATGGGLAQISMMKNGAQFHGAPAFDGPGSSVQDMNIASSPVSVTSGDYFELNVWQNSGAARSVAAFEWTWFGLEVVEAS